MQGQGSPSKPFEEAVSFFGGPSVNNLGLEQQNMALDASAHNESTVLDLLGESSSTVNNRNRFSFQQLLNEGDWDSAHGEHAGGGRRSAGGQPDQHIASAEESLDLSLSNDHMRNGNLDLNLSNGRARNGQSSLQGASSGALELCLDLNATFEDNQNEANQCMGKGLSLVQSGGSEIGQTASHTNSSSPIIISSGIAGYVVEDNEGMENAGRRLSCKRRAPEDASGQLSAGGSSSSAEQAGNHEQQAGYTEQHAVTGQANASGSSNILASWNSQLNVNQSEEVNTGFRASMQLTPVMHQVSGMAEISSGVGVAEQSGNLYRNLRLRTANQLDVIPENSSTWTPGISNIQSSNQPTRLFLFDQFPNTSSGLRAPFFGTSVQPAVPPILQHAVQSVVQPTVHPAVQPVVQIRNSSQALQRFLLNGSSTSAVGVPTTFSAGATNRGDALRLEENLRNHARNMMLPSEFQRRNWAQMPYTLNWVNGNMNIPRDVASTPRNGSSSGVRLPSAISGFSQANAAEEYVQRMTPFVSQAARQSNIEEYLQRVANVNRSEGRSNRSEEYAQRVAEIVNRSERQPHPAQIAAELVNRSERQPNPARRVADNRSELERFLTGEYARRMGNLANRRRQTGGEDIDGPVRNGNARTSQAPLRSVMATRAERQPGDYEIAGVVSPTAGPRTRSRLLSEIYDSLGAPHRGNTRSEDVLIIDRTTFYSMHEDDDAHGDMRLDVDNMSYEELLALEERIGNVSTGLTEEFVLENLSQRKYKAGEEADPCCICQEEYAEGDDIADLECGHQYHTKCISKWLVRKNSCPICKKTGVTARK